MNTRTKLLAGLAALGLVVWFALFRSGDGPSVVKPLRTASSSSPNPANPAGPAPHSGYDAFRLFHTRNVFDPDRRASRVAGSDTPPPAATPPPTRADFVALTGTLLDKGRSLAFFSGSRAEYNKVLSLRDHIAGAEITQITPASIEIDRAGQKTRVSVGQTVPFDGSAVPGAAPAPDLFASAPSTGSTAAVNGNASASNSSASSSKQDEIRRRLEERRRQEQK